MAVLCLGSVVGSLQPPAVFWGLRWSGGGGQTPKRFWCPASFLEFRPGCLQAQIGGTTSPAISSISNLFACSLTARMEVLVLTHENAKALELDPYHCIAFAPLRPKVIYGKNAKREQVKEDGKQRWMGREVVGSAFNEAVLRYCALPCFPDDHKFIIVEQDHRLWKFDSTIWAFMEEHGLDAVLQGQGIRESFKPQGSLQPPSEHLRDVLAHITAAKRWTTAACPGGHAEWIWMCSEPYFQMKKQHFHWTHEDMGGKKDHRKACPGTGNYMHMVTAKCARYVCKEVLVPPLG